MHSHNPPQPGLHIIVMAKRPVSGRVKTRLIGDLSPHQAAHVHAAMLQCVLDRLAEHLPGTHILAVDEDPTKPLSDPDQDLHVAVPECFTAIDQGTGDLGHRLGHVWSRLGEGPAVFFGVDSPDTPQAALHAIPAALTLSEAAVGPVDDGGYWCLAARRHTPALLTGIDWGTDAVYHQTQTAARSAGLSLHPLPPWHDVDTPDDLTALRLRLTNTQEPALARLRQRLDRITQDTHP